MKKIISLMLFFILSFTSIPFASALSIANCNLNCFSAGTPVLTNTGFKPIEEIRISDFVLTKDELTGKTGYNAVIELFQRQATETYQITVKGITITTTEEHPFWVPRQGWVEAKHLKAGDLLQNPEGKLYPIDRIEIKNDITTVYNFRVEGVHNYFITELEIWTHNCGAGGMRNIPMSAPSGGGGGSVSRGVQKTYQTYTKTNPTTGEVYSGRTSGTGTPRENIAKRDANHHKNGEGFGPAQLDKSSSNKDAIRGREQQLIDKNGGAKSQGGTSGNRINGISDKNKKKEHYRREANKEFPW